MDPMVWGIDVYIELNPEFNGIRVAAEPLPINDGDVPVLLPPPLAPVGIRRIHNTILEK